MSNKWAGQSAGSQAATDDEIAARRRAALAEISKEEAEEADAEMSMATSAYNRADRSRSKGRAESGGSNLRASAASIPSMTQKLSQPKLPGVQPQPDPEEEQARRRAQARAALRAEESEDNRRQEQILSGAAGSASKNRGRSKGQLIPPSTNSAAVAAAAEDYQDDDFE